MKRNQSGFTLIEIAIVLVIIGLLLGGVLKGQELINSAKVKNLANDFKNIPVYIYGYQDKYKALPGMTACQHAGCRTSAGLATRHAARHSGERHHRRHLERHSTATDESFVFWQHVRLAGFGPGATLTTEP